MTPTTQLFFQWAFWVLMVYVAVIVVLIVRGPRPHMPWVYWQHKLRRHDVHWFARNGHVTKVLCRTCQWGRFYGE